MKVVFHVSDGAPEIQDAAIRYARGTSVDESVDISDVVVVTNGTGVELVESTSTFAEDIRELSAGNVTFVACAKSLQAAGLTPEDILDEVDTAPTSVGELTRRQEHGYQYIKVP